MSTALPAPAAAIDIAGRRRPPLSLVVGEGLRLRLLWLMMIGGAFVFAEPSPYEIGALVTIGAFAVTGAIALRPALMPVVFVLIVYCLGLTISSVQVMSDAKVVPWTAVSWYLAVTMVFFAAVLADNTGARLDAIVRGWTLASLIAALAGISGYFRLFPAAFDLFTLYGRAKGTFNDPNVFGPFLIFPMLIAMQAFLRGGAGAMLRAGALLGLLTIALLLSFSRGAWAHFVVSAAIMVALMFITAESRAERWRIVLVVAAGLVVAAAFVLVLLSIDRVADLMRERANFNQSYDNGPMGRFGRHAYGWQLALDRPLGLGPLQFAKYFVEDVHNVYLDSFIAGGWIAGTTYLVLVGMTLFAGIFASFKRTPWQATALAAVATYCGLAFEGKIIDTEHWRHFWVLSGVIWGVALANRNSPLDIRLGRLAARGENA
ncbi:O-antigen ligase family protein [Phreatobacter sp. AB_2022a]|uniref:O-antigen ligase family protein n=1 Tax=Phreatobacter sp. AB_2022a TaxID=3003134 RepID=UPI0022875874|nr:O-antigen ligase family protein [Phreatobacter sp. AB_2022a]MCZ0735440.1 O-antigen ligase family protein [Phreatobacter sp. AB_2022a]